MTEDMEGFLYPQIDKHLCIDCGLCEKVCPVLHQEDKRQPLKTFGTKNPDEEVRMQSSSGGIFTVLAENVIKQGGVVFGVKMNNRFAVEHDYTETIEGLSDFRGSKYLQSKIDKSFISVKLFLKQNRLVLFSGTPCQILGLRKFLGTEYEKLLLVECICHSVPSPIVWQTYLKETCRNLKWHRNDIKRVEFRNKQNGWSNYRFRLTRKDGSYWEEPHEKNSYMRGFLYGLYTRPSCHACPAKSLSSGADITLGDFWGIETLRPDLDDNRGLSAVTANTERGLSALLATKAELHEVEYMELVERNPAIVRSAAVPAAREEFFAEDGLTFHEKINKLCRLTFRSKCRKNVKRFITTCLGSNGEKIFEDFLNRLRYRSH